MIAKIIAHAPTRNEALDKLAKALGQTIVAGPKTNTAFLKALCNADGFRKGDFDTGFIDRNLEQLGAVEQPLDETAVKAGVARLLQREQSRLGGSSRDPWSVFDGFAVSSPNEPRLDVLAAGTRRLMPCEPAPGATIHSSTVVDTSESILVIRNGRQTEIRLFDPLDVDFDSLDIPEGGALVKAPMHGKLTALFVKAGDLVAKGAKLAIVEAMKMEHALVAPRDGVVTETFGTVGAQVGEGAKLVVIAEIEA